MISLVRGSLESIPYQSIDLPHNVTDFIAIHDQEDVGLANKPFQDITLKI